MATEAGKEPEADGEPSGISAFIAKVLNQLSLSAWLPAAIFAAAMALLYQFRASQSLDIGTAITAITGDPVALLILLIPVLVLTTMLTQAFSFSAIRILEGYWLRRGPVGLLRSARIRHHAKRRARLETRRRRAALHAFGVVRVEFLRTYSSAIVDALELQAAEEDVPTLPAIDQARYESASWRDMCHPWDLANVDQLDIQLADYPLLPNRTMPTKLGNVLRRTEDMLEHGGDDVQGFAMRRRSLVPARVQTQHDQFRDRLDMYCTLVFVSTVLAVASTILLWNSVRWWETAGLAVAFLAFAWVCYGSAISSARGYGVVLRRMDEPETPPTP
jgi:hypothetical protein